MNACLTDAQFAALLSTLRSRLLQTARNRHGALSDDDAEDLVAETVLIALHILPKFVPDSAKPDGGILSWLFGVMASAANTERKRARRRPPTLPLESARNIPAPPQPESSPGNGSLPWAWPTLPYSQQQLVRGWLDGRSQTELAQRYRIHRNTVGNRLELAFQTLRRAMPRADELDYSFSLINSCSHHYVYRPPSGMSRRWFSRCPPTMRLGSPSFPDPEDADDFPQQLLGARRPPITRNFERRGP